MHELSIAMSIVDVATDAVQKANAHHVDVIELDIGTMAGIEFGALDFAWPVAVNNTVLENAERVIHKIQAVGKCSSCGCEYNVENQLQACPACGEVFFNYIKGKELRVKSLTVS